MRETNKIAIVGAGVVGASWALVFARAGYRVEIFDQEPSAGRAAVAACRDWAGQLQHCGLLRDPVSEVLDRLRIASDLETAVDGAWYVQESVREDIELKRAVTARIAPLLAGDSVVGSSTSGFPASAFTEGLPHRDRFLVVHPVNPPHLVPVVEIVPAPWSSENTIGAACDLMREVGQKPVLVRKEIEGFILNRLQGALLDEALRLYAGGYASLADIDATVSHGLGRRWSMIGPFETIDLNAAQGLQDYARHLAPMYRRIAETKPDCDPWADDAIDRAHRDRRALLPETARDDRLAWRDDMLIRIAALVGSSVSMET